MIAGERVRRRKKIGRRIRKRKEEGE